jgi:hypothetical protein
LKISELTAHFDVSIDVQINGIGSTAAIQKADLQVGNPSLPVKLRLHGPVNYKP